LGLGIAGRLALTGFQVVVIARSTGQELPVLQSKIEKAGKGSLHFRAFDLLDLDGIADLVKQLSKDFGRFYGLVNNAGIGTAGVLATMPAGAIEKLIRLNVVSPITITKYIVRSMMTGGPDAGGRIVNMASVVANTGFSGLSVYSATKASLVGFTRSLSRELGPLGITVNAVAPGFVDTEMTHALNEAQRAQIARRSALQRMADVSDIANAVAFLFSEEARNITGTVITVDAGNTA
jgi:3-oxoacyl-[acyl-carrier protein] reductase